MVKTANITTNTSKNLKGNDYKKVETVQSSTTNRQNLPTKSKKTSNKTTKKTKKSKLVKNTNQLAKNTNKTIENKNKHAKEVNRKVKNAVKKFCDKYYDKETKEYIKIPNIFAICQIAKINYKSLTAANGAYEEAYNFLKCWITNILLETGDKMAKDGKRTDWWRFRASVFLPKEPIQVESKNLNVQLDLKMLPIAQKALKDLDITTDKLTDKTKDCALLDEQLLKQEAIKAGEAKFEEIDDDEEESEFDINDFIPSEVSEDKDKAKKKKEK